MGMLIVSPFGDYGYGGAAYGGAANTVALAVGAPCTMNDGTMGKTEAGGGCVRTVAGGGITGGIANGRGGGVNVFGPVSTPPPSISAIPSAVPSANTGALYGGALIGSTAVQNPAAVPTSGAGLVYGGSAAGCPPGTMQVGGSIGCKPILIGVPSPTASCPSNYLRDAAGVCRPVPMTPAAQSSVFTTSSAAPSQSALPSAAPTATATSVLAPTSSAAPATSVSIGAVLAAAGAGFLVGGPIGAAVGAGAGYFLGKKSAA